MEIKSEKSGFLRRGFASAAYGWAIFAALGYFLGMAELPFGARPFGFALICSSGAYTVPALTGAILSALGTPRAAAYVTAYAATAAARVLISLALSALSRRGGGAKDRRGAWLFSRLFGEPTALRVLFAAASAFLLSLYFVIKSDFLLYYTYSAIISAAASALAALLWRGFAERFEQNGSYLLSGEAHSFKLFFGKEKGEFTLGDMLCSAAFLSLSALLVRGAVGISAFGISLSALFAMILTLVAVKRLSLLEGALVGALCGLAINPLISPAFVFGAVAFGFLSPISTFLGAIGAFSVGIWWGFYSTGLSALSSLLPAFLAATLIFTVLDGLISAYLKRKKSDEAEASKEKDEPSAEDFSAQGVGSEALVAKAVTELREGDARRELIKISDGLASLSDKLYDLSSQADGAIRERGDLWGICEKAFDSACGGCSEREICRADAEFSDELGAIGGIIRRGEHAQSSAVGEGLRSRCGRLPDILDEINYNSALWRALAQERDFTEFFALDYRILSELISANERELSKEYEPNRALCERAAVKINEALGDRISDNKISVSVLGGRKKRAVVSVALSEQKGAEAEAAETVKKALSAVCGVRFELIESRSESRFLTAIYEQKPKISVSVEGRCAIAEGEELYCGDSYGTRLDEPQGKLIAFISDGMGCGREASEASRITSLFLQNILPISYSCEQTAQMLNSFLRRRGSDSLSECSATLDLTEIDLLTSRAAFCKSGAAPTYILRGETVFKIRARTIPIGIISEIDIKRVELELYDGDIIVMVSDGVTQGKEECPRLFELLKSNRSSDLKRISELVLKYALDNGGKDDISVLALRVDAV